MVLLIASYCCGYNRRANLYKKSYEVLDGLDNLPETSAISVIGGSKWAEKFSHVEMGKLKALLFTNNPSK